MSEAPHSADEASIAVEAQRQQRLVQALWRRGSDAALAPWLRDDDARRARGLSAYRANASAMAARALAAAYPTVAALVGEEAMQAIAAAHWLRCPPERGDLALFGESLADALAADPRLADLPYLADVARLDWAAHRCESAADAGPATIGLDHLADTDPALLALDLQPATAVIASRWPIVTIRKAHEAASTQPDRFADAREALARGDAQAAIVWRRGWRVHVECLRESDRRFTAALLEARTLAAALDAAGADFDFESWLVRALREGWLACVRKLSYPGGSAPSASSEASADL